MNRQSFNQAGGWPEDYFMYAEDLDLFYCCHRKGIPVNFSPVAVMHVGGGVTYKIWNPEQRATIIEKSFRKFYRKYHAGWEYYLVRPLQLVYILFNDRAQFWLHARVFMKNLTN
jgi:GT2 family glycosyltransferase